MLNRTSCLQYEQCTICVNKIYCLQYLHSTYIHFHFENHNKNHINMD